MADKKEAKRVERLKYKTRVYSIKTGLFASIRDSFGTNYVSPFAVAINSSNALVAMISSITGLVGPISEIFGSRLIERYPRKKIVRRTVLLEALSWIPFILIAVFYSMGILIQALPIILLLSFALYTILSNFGYPAWFSWMGDIVGEKIRGRWFSKRNLLMGIVSVIMTIIASFFLDYLKKNNLTMLGFGILFLLALLARLLSWKIFKKFYEPEIKLKKGDYFSFTEFLLNAKNNNFGRFAFFRFFFTFANSISSPLVVIYLLRTLNFSYSEYMIIIFAGTGVSLFVLEMLGKFSDSYGSYRTLCISSWMLAVLPFLWILNHSFIYLLLVPSVMSGIGWAGVHLTELNITYENVKPEKRGLAMSYYNMLWGLGIFFGAGLGALLIKFLDISFMQPIVFIFILGGIARVIMVAWWLPKISEVRKTRKFRGGKTFREIVFKQAIPTITGEFHDIVHLKKYFFMK